MFTDPPFNPLPPTGMTLLTSIFVALYSTSSIMSSTKPSFDTMTLGNNKDAISIQLLKCPHSDAPLLDKVQAFAYFKEVIRQHQTQLSSSTIQQAYANNIPVSSSKAASKEANCIGCQLYESFFLIANLSCLKFFWSDGSHVSIALHPCWSYLEIHQTTFDLTTMITKDCQVSALCKLWSLAVKSHNSLQDDRQSMGFWMPA